MGTTIIPFKDKFDKSLKLYSLMTTKPEEVEQREKEGGGSLGRERTEGREKVVSKMTRDGLTEENLADGSVKDISHKSRGRPLEMKQDFVFEPGKEERQAVRWTKRGTESAKKSRSETPLCEKKQYLRNLF